MNCFNYSMPGWVGLWSVITPTTAVKLYLKMFKIIYTILLIVALTNLNTLCVYGVCDIKVKINYSQYETYTVQTNIDTLICNKHFSVCVDELLLSDQCFKFKQEFYITFVKINEYEYFEIISVINSSKQSKHNIDTVLNFDSLLLSRIYQMPIVDDCQDLSWKLRTSSPTKYNSTVLTLYNYYETRPIYHTETLYSNLTLFHEFNHIELGIVSISHVKKSDKWRRWGSKLLANYNATNYFFGKNNLEKSCKDMGECAITEFIKLNNLTFVPLLFFLNELSHFSDDGYKEFVLDYCIQNNCEISFHELKQISCMPIYALTINISEDRYKFKKEFIVAPWLFVINSIYSIKNINNKPFSEFLEVYCENIHYNDLLSLNLPKTFTWEDKHPSNTFKFVEQMPEFPGGMDALIKYLDDVSYPSSAIDNKLEGRAIVRFVIDIQGRTTEHELIRSSGHDILDRAAIEHIRNMPEWTPGVEKGQKVPVEFTVPVKFSLENLY